MKWAAIVIAAFLFVTPACNVLDYMTGGEKEQAQELKQQEATLAERISALEVRQAAGEDVTFELADLRSQLEQTRSERGELEAAVGARTVGGLIDFIDGFVPVPLQPFKSQLSAAIALLAFKRSRKHLKRGVRSLSRLDLRDAGASVMRSVGLMHSNTDPLDVLEGARTAALERGDQDAADRIATVQRDLRLQRIDKLKQEHEVAVA